MTTTYQYVEGVKDATTVSFVKYTVTADDATANVANISTPSGLIAGANVDVYRSNVDVKGDAVVTFSASTLSVADGATYVLTAGDVIIATVFGAAE